MLASELDTGTSLGGAANKSTITAIYALQAYKIVSPNLKCRNLSTVGFYHVMNNI